MFVLSSDPSLVACCFVYLRSSLDCSNIHHTYASVRMNAIPLHIAVPSLNIIFCGEKYLKSYAPSLGFYNPEKASSVTA